MCSIVLNMKLWFYLCSLIIGYVRSENMNRYSKSRDKLNPYTMEFIGELYEYELIFDPIGQDHSLLEDWKIHDWMAFIQLNVSGSNVESFKDCQTNRSVTCDVNYPYRTMDGSCNNLNNPLSSAANQCFRRYLSPHYTGFGDARKSVTGASLPEPRQLSLNILQNRHRPTPDASFMFAMFGQTVAHDISSIVFDYDRQSCCLPQNLNQSYCMVISVSKDDPFYSQFGVDCLEFSRALPCNACNTDKRQQINGQTTPIDASTVYGPSDSTAKGLRTNDGTGRLLTNHTKKGELLPSGDDRVNQHAALTGLQTVYVREHNRIAVQLKELNPNWDDERLYQEARRIVIAQLQHITYHEFLPLLLGHFYMSNFDLYVQQGSFGSKYDPTIPLEAKNEFSAAAFRIHSMVATSIGVGTYRFKDLYSNPEVIWRGRTGKVLQGACTVPSEEFDRWFVDDVTNFFHQQPGVPYGSDLAALDIIRGRDHGLAPYVYYVYVCSDGQVNIQSFDDLEYYNIMSQEHVELLKKYYANVRDVDLWVALQLEYSSRGAKVGPTSACFIARQFYFLKYGDRFHYEHIGEAGSFTSAQRASIKETSLSRILCDNTGISQIQQQSMIMPSWKNPKIQCADLPRLNLSLWKEF